MSDTLKDGSYYKLYTQAKSTSACGLPKGFLINWKRGSLHKSSWVGRRIMNDLRSFVIMEWMPEVVLYSAEKHIHVTY